ncbi:regulatory protein RecX [Nitrosomonadaceae bacterium]|nr:recombination regulator RecX [Nitrosospira sp.]MBI0412823.1 recombination regulator RecX [Nitrosospira sp.]GDX59910.1 regulatory protein RecX [Nitrosomonadaceae bacterium]
MKGRANLKDRALGYLARREHSRLELERKLLPHAQGPSEISVLLDAMEQQGLLSASRVIEQVARVCRKRFGIGRIVYELRKKGIDEHLISAAVPDLKKTELEAAQEVWRKRFATQPADAQDHGKQMRFLRGRGFATEVIHQVLLPSDE